MIAAQVRHRALALRIRVHEQRERALSHALRVGHLRDRRQRLRAEQRVQLDREHRSALHHLQRDRHARGDAIPDLCEEDGELREAARDRDVTRAAADRGHALRRDVAEVSEQLGGREQILAELRPFLEQSRQSPIGGRRRGRPHVRVLAGRGVHTELADADDVDPWHPLELRHQRVDAVRGRERDLMRERDVHADRHELRCVDRSDLVVELGERLRGAGGDRGHDFGS